MPKLTTEEIKAKLTELGVAYDEDTSYGNLLELLKAEEDRGKEIALKAETPEEKKAVEELSKKAEEVTEVKNPFSSFETKLPMTGKAQEMRKKLLSQTRVPVMIPLSHGEKVGSTHQVTLNGYTMFIRKGQMVDVPIQVKKVLEEKFQHQMHVLEHPLLVGSGDPKDVKLTKFD